MAETVHPAAVEHLPIFITAPGQTDVLLVVMAAFLLLIVLLAGVLYFRLHALPEQMAHGASKGQLQLVAVLALIALFTHNHLFWIAALLLALIEFPDFSSPLRSIARSLRRIAGQDAKAPQTASPEIPVPPAKPAPAQAERHLAPVELSEASDDELSERKG